MNLFKFHAESMIVSFAVLSDTPQLAILPCSIYEFSPDIPATSNNMHDPFRKKSR